MKHAALTSSPWRKLRLRSLLFFSERLLACFRFFRGRLARRTVFVFQVLHDDGNAAIRRVERSFGFAQPLIGEAAHLGNLPTGHTAVLHQPARRVRVSASVPPCCMQVLEPLLQQRWRHSCEQPLLCFFCFFPILQNIRDGLIDDGQEQPFCGLWAELIGLALHSGTLLVHHLYCCLCTPISLTPTPSCAERELASGPAKARRAPLGKQ
jgi:hypothetical protein